MNNKAVAAIIAAKDEGRVFGRVREAEPVVSTRVTAADAREAVAAVHTVRAFIDQCQDPHLAAAHAASLSHAVDGEAGIKAAGGSHAPDVSCAEPQAQHRGEAEVAAGQGA